MLANNSMCSLAVNASHRISNCNVIEQIFIFFFKYITTCMRNAKKFGVLPVDRLQSSYEYYSSPQCFEQNDHK